MTTTRESGHFYIPDTSTPNGNSNLTAISTNNSEVATIFQITRSGTIDKVYFEVNTNATPGTIDVRLETVSATTGAPSGTLYATGSNGSCALSSSANVEQVVTFGTPIVVTQGDIVALVFKNPSSSPASFVLYSLNPNNNFGMPYSVRSTDGSTFTKSNGSISFGFHYTADATTTLTRYSVFSQMVMAPSQSPLSGGSSIGYAATPNTGSDMYGNKFVAPGAFEVSGVWGAFSTNGLPNSVTHSLKMYDSTNTLVGTTGALTSESGNPSSSGLRFFEFASKVILVPGATYRVVVDAHTSSTAIGSFSLLEGATPGRQFACISQGIFYETNANGGFLNWRDYTMQFRFIGLVCTGISA